MRMFDGDVDIIPLDAGRLRIKFTSCIGEVVASDVKATKLLAGIAGLIEKEALEMTDKTNQAAAAEQQIDNVLGAFEAELDKLAARAKALSDETKGAFLDAHSVFDHGEAVNKGIRTKVARLRSFFGPPPNSLGVSEAQMIEHDPLTKAATQ